MTIDKSGELGLRAGIYGVDEMTRAVYALKNYCY